MFPVSKNPKYYTYNKPIHTIDSIDKRIYAEPDFLYFVFTTTHNKMQRIFAARSRCASLFTRQKQYASFSTSLLFDDTQIQVSLYY